MEHVKSGVVLVQGATDNDLSMAARTLHVSKKEKGERRQPIMRVWCVFHEEVDLVLDRIFKTKQGAKDFIESQKPVIYICQEWEVEE